MWRWQVTATWLVATWLVGRSTGDTESAVRILNQYQQLVTSSTLLWVEARAGLEHTVSSGSTYVCRLLADGMWVPGALREDECEASMHGRVLRSRDAQLLQNVEGGGRLSWQRWENSALGAGAVAAGDDPKLMYVARRHPDLLGRLDLSLGLLGKLVVLEPDGLEHEYKEGELLVETEPNRYEMDDVVLQTWRARAHRDPLTLGHATLRNNDEPRADGDPDAGASRVAAVIPYDHNTTVGWGHGHAVLSGLPVSVRLRNGEALPSFRWAIDNTTVGKAMYQVETLLPPGTGRNVTLRANWTESNVPYEARITAVYGDQQTRARTLVGVRREVGLRDVRPDFGPLFYLADGTLVPTTSTSTTSSTTTTTSSTPAPTTTTTSSSSETPPAPADTMQKRPTGANGTVDMQADGPGAARGEATTSAGVAARALATLMVVCALVAT